jgi:hypothetical protein
MNIPQSMGCRLKMETAGSSWDSSGLLSKMAQEVTLAGGKKFNLLKDLFQSNGHRERIEGIQFFACTFQSHFHGAS